MNIPGLINGRQVDLYDWIQEVDRQVLRDKRSGTFQFVTAGDGGDFLTMEAAINYTEGKTYELLTSGSSQTFTAATVRGEQEFTFSGTPFTGLNHGGNYGLTIDDQTPIIRCMVYGNNKLRTYKPIPVTHSSATWKLFQLKPITVALLPGQHNTSGGTILPPFVTVASLVRRTARIVLTTLGSKVFSQQDILGNENWIVGIEAYLRVNNSGAGSYGGDNNDILFLRSGAEYLSCDFGIIDCRFDSGWDIVTAANSLFSPSGGLHIIDNDIRNTGNAFSLPQCQQLNFLRNRIYCREPATGNPNPLNFNVTLTPNTTYPDLGVTVQANRIESISQTAGQIPKCVVNSFTLPAQTKIEVRDNHLHAEALAGNTDAMCMDLKNIPADNLVHCNNFGGAKAGTGVYNDIFYDDAGSNIRLGFNTNRQNATITKAGAKYTQLAGT